MQDEQQGNFMNFVALAIKNFGSSFDSAEVQSMLALMPAYRLDKPSDGSQYLISRDGGFDLLFEDKEAIFGRRQNRILTGVFLYANGADKHKEFSGELPYGFTCAENRSQLLAKCQPNRTWVIGQGRVLVTYTNPDSDTWLAETCNISASYFDDGRVHNFLLTPPAELDEATEWKPSSA
jgi:hypothetical protein